jgi:hypothetical protein
MRCLLCVLLLLCVTGLLAQEAPAGGNHEVYSRAWYSRRAKRQKTMAYVFVASGVSASITGAYLLRSDTRTIYQVETETQRGKREARERTGTFLAVGGLAVVAGSIPWFVSSARNRRMARLQVVNETSFFPDPAQRRSFAALGLRIGL